MSDNMNICASPTTLNTSKVVDSDMLSAPAALSEVSDFTVVSRKKKNRKNKKTYVVKTKTLDDYLEKLEDFKLQLTNSRLFLAIRDALDQYDLEMTDSASAPASEEKVDSVDASSISSSIYADTTEESSDPSPVSARTEPAPSSHNEPNIHMQQTLQLSTPSQESARVEAGPEPSQNTTSSLDSLTFNQVKSASHSYEHHTTKTTQRTSLTSIRCLALGSPTESHLALYQLALLQLLTSHLKMLPEKVSMWDPVFVAADLELFEALGYKTEEVYEKQTEELLTEELQTESQTKRDSRQGTLVYMVHAPPSLTESIISKMADPSSTTPTFSELELEIKLKHPATTATPPSYSVCIGNHLVNYSNHLLAEDLATKFPTINEVVSGEVNDWRVTEIEDKLSKDEMWMWAFNDLSIYWKK